MPKVFKSWNSYGAFAWSVRKNTRYFQDRKARRFLNTVLETAEKRVMVLPARKLAFRAQIGCVFEDATSIDGQSYPMEMPFGAERMKPLRHSAHEGRVNPRGIPCLYVANNRDTAVAEVRPWVGALVSVARLSLSRELRLVNCTDDGNFDAELFFEEPPPDEREEIVWRAIARAFSKPVTDDPGLAEYAPTQVLAEEFKYRGYDGVAYRSRLGTGFNVAVFDLDALDVVYLELHRVQRVSYETHDMERGGRAKPPGDANTSS